ncbi:MAG: AMP-binding protein [Bacteroidales bacterium]|jgi:long-chain acyl-CoA synthetase|nr:AMP-binding protein [Bacteroidales bacterium]
MQTLPEFFEYCVETFSENIYLWEKTGEYYKGITYRQTRDKVYQLAAGLISLGVRKGDRIALISEGRNDWVISELAMFYAGAVNVPLSVKLSEPVEIRFRLSHSAVRFIFTSGNQVKKIRLVKNELPLVEKIILLDNVPLETDNEILFNDLLVNGQNFLKSGKETLIQRQQSVLPGDIANICYTSGTTADPKGIMLTHANYITNVNQGYSLFDLDKNDRTLLVLPWDHAFAHTAGIYCFMGKGASVASVQNGKSALETIRNIQQNIREIKPHILLSVPALASNFKKNIEKSIQEKGRFINRLFKHALRISYRYNGNGLNTGKGLTILYKPLICLYDMLFFRKIREGFGGNLKFFIGGGALLDIEFQRFFYALGIPMFQGYGLTEASPVISSNGINKHKLGSSGALVAEMDLKICDEAGKELPGGKHGEIVIRGGNVMKGYWENPEATAKTIRDGWLYTGDLGYLDTDNFLYVLGRFKSLLIGHDGEKYSPEGIEEAITGSSRLIDQCMLYNNQNPYTVAFVVPNKESLKNHLRNKESNTAPQDLICMALATIEKDLLEYRPDGKFGDLFPQRWLPSAIAILGEHFSEENRLMNSTAKIVRGKIIERYKEDLDFLYSSEAKYIYNKRNLEVMEQLLFDNK